MIQIAFLPRFFPSMRALGIAIWERFRTTAGTVPPAARLPFIVGGDRRLMGLIPGRSTDFSSAVLGPLAATLLDVGPAGGEEKQTFLLVVERD